ncbi:MAG: glycosyltransferase family 2 protein [Yoonia sp.]|uniref:glycosyltransferase family 2 protein n=1 Tax=Yoonia sp. TaxID=2212373 RepID=UPI0032652165
MIQATVIIAAWNSEDSLCASVESALAQTEVSLEVIVVDDCSTDKTLIVARDLALAHPQVRVLSQQRNGGPAVARNAALAEAKGEWVAVLDADDTFVSGRLAAMIDFADSVDADIVCDGIMTRDAANDFHQTATLAFAGDPQNDNWTVAEYIAGNMHGTPGLSLGYLKPVIRRSFITKHTLRYDENLRNGEDFHFILDALTNGAAIRFRAEPGYVYSVGHESISRRLNADHATALARADLAFAARHAEDLDPHCIAMMQKRAQSTLDLSSAEQALAALRDRRPLRAARVLWRRPRATGRFLRQLAQAVTNRLHRR